MTNEDALRSIKASLEEFKRMFESDQRNCSHLENEFGQLRNKFSEIEARAGGASDEEVKSLRRRMDELEAASRRLPQGRFGSSDSIGQRFIASEACKNFKAGQQSSSAAVDIGSFFERKAGEITGASLGDLPAYAYPAHRVPELIGPPLIQPRVRDLLPVLPLSVGAVEFVRQASATNLAAVQDEENVAAKAQSALSMEAITTAVKTIAHWLPASRQIISDAPALAGFVDAFLLKGLADVEDEELLNGDGTSTHLTGLLTDPDIQLLTQGADDNAADAIRKAMLLVEVLGYQASGIILNPNDWAAIELLKDEQGRYLFAQPQQRTLRQLWGVPVALSIALDEGAFCTGALDRAACIWDREQSTVRVSDQHSDFFTKNLVAILAEERLALTVFRPEAIVLGTFTGAGS
jgi:HK97 family phage major capsid protein